MKSIYMIDGGFFVKKFRQSEGRFPAAIDVKNFIDKFHSKNQQYINDDYLRIYFYHCSPLEQSATLPISRQSHDFKNTNSFRENTILLNGLKQMEFVSVREGNLIFVGWKIKQGIRHAPTSDADFSPDIVQKGVDIKIGLDIAWVSLSHISDQIVLITSDSDFIPAMKFARRNGIQVYLLTLNHGVFDGLKEHTDKTFTEPINIILNS